MIMITRYDDDYESGAPKKAVSGAIGFMGLRVYNEYLLGCMEWKLR